MNASTADNAVQWLFLNLNAFFASCEQQDNQALRGQAIIVVQTLTSSACTIAASYEAKRLGITTGTLVRDAKRICPAVIPVQARHQLYTEYHERMLAAVDTCVPVDKVMSIDELACRLMGDQRQLPVAHALAMKIKHALREQIGECLTCSIGIAPNVFLGKVGSDLQKPTGWSSCAAAALDPLWLAISAQPRPLGAPRAGRRSQIPDLDEGQSLAPGCSFVVSCGYRKISDPVLWFLWQ
jgi:DNA polymerase IV